MLVNVESEYIYQRTRISILRSQAKINNSVYIYLMIIL